MIIFPMIAFFFVAISMVFINTRDMCNPPLIMNIVGYIYLIGDGIFIIYSLAHMS